MAKAHVARSQKKCTPKHPQQAPKAGSGEYSVWLMYDGSPVRRLSMGVSAGVAIGQIERWKKDLEEHSSQSYALMCDRTGRMIQY